MRCKIARHPFHREIYQCVRSITSGSEIHHMNKTEHAGLKNPSYQTINRPQHWQTQLNKYCTTVTNNSLEVTNSENIM